MKFAVVALIATTSAIRIEAQGKGCATKEFTNEGFEARDPAAGHANRNQEGSNQ